jgi:hypothetical protein
MAKPGQAVAARATVSEERGECVLLEEKEERRRRRSTQQL